MKKTGVAVALLVAFGSVVACSDQRTPSESTASTKAPIQGGSNDTSHPFAVGFCIDVPGNGTVDCNNLNVDICSGALIAPNLVVTARHCVQNTDEQIDCSTSAFSGQRASLFYITTDPDFASATHWHQVANINVPNPTPVCGNDIALLTLQDNVPAAEATPITPVVQYPMSTHPMYSRQVTAIGYGATQAGTNPPGAGTRRIKGSIPIECVADDNDLYNCAGVFDGSGTIDPKEFITGNGTCQGDSGSSAYDQASFGSNFQSFGVLSRGGENGTTCEEAIYTRLDSWRDLIVQVATTAATAGGYPVPDWTKPAPPIVDSGSPTQGGTGQLGDSCTGNKDCASNDCSHDICTQSCDDSNPCPDGYDCSNSLCVASQSTGDNPGSTTTTTTSSCGCKLAGGPNNPVPWKTLGVAIGAMILVRRRRR